VSVGAIAGTHDSQGGREDDMGGVAKATAKRTQQRLAARKEAAKRGAETRRRNQEARAKGQAAEAAKQALVAARAAAAQKQQPPAGDEQTGRPERKVAQTGRAVGPMATVALRGEQAVRFRALAAARGVSLARLLVQMIEAFEEQAG